jgi:malonyl-CoA/methylmalonyl-CoA synthetase
VSLTAAWAAHWCQHPERTVLIDAGSGAALGGAEVDRLTALVAGRLSRLGVGRGDRVLLSCDPGLDTVLAYTGVLRLGAVVVPANTGYTTAELAHLIGDARPVVAVVDDLARPIDVPLGTHLAADLSQVTSGGIDATEPDPIPLDDAADDDLAMIGYTSGTTGRPKGAMLDHGNLRAGAEALVQAWEWTANDRLVHALPMFHMHGLGAAINGSFTAGASMVVLERFDPSAVVEAASAYDASLFFGVPTMYARLRDSGLLPHLAHLRLLVSGSAPLDPVLFQAISAAVGQAPVERYGMTETVMLTSNPVRGERRAGSVGRALPGVELRLADDGGVQVRGRTVFRGYWERPDATRDAITPDGWFRTGDIGELDPDGYLRLVGRASDLIITGGYNVYPREVEDAVRSHPGVADVAVVGVADDTWGERVVAFVVPATPATGQPTVATDDTGATPEAADLAADLATQLARHVADLLAPYKRPRTWTLVDELPRNAMGKVRRDVLVARSGRQPRS